MKKTNEELEQLVTSLQAQLDFAKVSELNLVNRITSLGEEKNQLIVQIDQMRVDERDMALERARNELESEFESRLRDATVAARNDNNVLQMSIADLQQKVDQDRLAWETHLQSLEQENGALSNELIQANQTITNNGEVYRIQVTGLQQTISTLTTQLTELNSLVDTLKTTIAEQQLIVDRAKSAELTLVERIRSISQDNERLTSQLASREVIDTEAVYKRAKVEYEAEFKAKEIRKEAAWAVRLKTEVDKQAQQIADDQMQQERTDNTAFRQQVGQDLRSAQEQASAATAQVVELQEQLKAATDQYANMVSSFQQQLADMKQAITSESTIRGSAVVSLSKELEDARQTVAFMKTAELDLVNRWKTIAEELNKEKAAHEKTQELLAGFLSGKDADVFRQMYKRPGE